MKIVNRLWLQLSIGFALVTLVSTLTVALAANAAASTTFRGYLAQSQAVESGIVAQLAEHYAAQGSWAGAERLLSIPRGAGPGHGQGRAQGAMQGNRLALADADGRMLVDSAGSADGARLSTSEQAAALPITVQGRIVGYVLARTPPGAALPPAAEHVLATLNNLLWMAGLLAGVLGLALGLLIARGLAAPLGQLAAGARRVAKGGLDERVPVAGPAEVQIVAAAFNEMAAALEAGESQRRHMVADIAHELRTPLTVVQGNLRAMLDDVYPLSKGEVATIYEASLGLGRLVDDLRLLSLAEAGRLELRPQPVAVVPLLTREVALFADLAADQGVTLRVEVPDALPEVLADPERLAQMLHNLVSNALRHTPPGGIVTLGAQGSSADPSQVGAMLCLSVIDTGGGIAPEDLAHVFERFYRADKGRARGSGGSGLGLAITRQLALLQGGTIGVESLPGQGACFWFTLPVVPALFAGPDSGSSADTAHHICQHNATTYSAATLPRKP